MSTQVQQLEEAAAQASGFRAMVFLAVLTIVEYFIAVGIDSGTVVLLLLIPIALVKGWVILMTFMHLGKVWHGEGSH